MKLGLKLFPMNGVQRLVDDVTVDLKKLSLNAEKTVVVNIDPIVGFFLRGAMASPRLEKIIPKIEKVNDLFDKSRKLFFIDSHSAVSTEFTAYPLHCVTEDECKIIPELNRFLPDSDVIDKNCTNGFLAPDYVKWLGANLPTIENIIVTGGMSDISVMQYALTQKAHFNEIDCKAKVIVVENATQTFDTQAHNGDNMHAFAMYNLYKNGVIIARI